MKRSLLPPCLALLVGAACTKDTPPADMDIIEEPDLGPRPDLSPPPDLTSSVAATTTGFDVPESAYWHKGSGAWYVSNLALAQGAKLTDKDKRGWISKLDADGKVVTAKWVESGLSSPAGIRATAGQLVVADIDELVLIDLTTRAVTRVAVPGAALLNDVDVADDGTIYATDTFGNALWAYKPGEAPRQVLKDPQLNQPNGILATSGRLLIASTGPFDKPDPGALWRYNLESQELTPLGFAAKLDGMEADGEALVLSENPTARIYRLVTGQAPLLIRDMAAQDGLKSAGDIGLDPERRLLAVPDLQGNTVTFVRLP